MWPLMPMCLMVLKVKLSRGDLEFLEIFGTVATNVSIA